MTTNADLCLPESKEVPLSQVEGELARQLKRAYGAGDDPVHRARMSNLVIFCDTPERAVEVEKAIPEIVTIHPARVLLLIADDHSGSSEIHATILVRKAGHETRLCSEQITLHGGSHSIEHLPFAVRSLLIGDLPTNIWWATPTPPAMAGAVFDDLTEHAQQVIYDSLGWPDPNRGIAATSTWLSRFERSADDGHWRVASDLNWRRLKYWRRIISQAFAPATAPGALESVSEILIEHGPHAVTMAWMLVGWMASRLGWKVKASRLNPGVEISLQMNTPHGSLRLRIDRLPEGPSEIRRINFACTIDGTLGALDFVSDDSTRITVNPEGVDASPRTLAIQPLDTADIVGRQLSDREPDATFREAMAAAHTLALAVLQR